MKKHAHSEEVMREGYLISARWMDVRERRPETVSSCVEFWQNYYPEYAAEAESLLRERDSLSLQGHVVVDGNHLFLHAFELCKSSLERIKALDPIAVRSFGEQPDHRMLSYVAMQLAHRVIDAISRRLVEDHTDSASPVVSTEYLIREDPDAAIEILRKAPLVIENLWQIRLFDAELPTTERALDELRQRRSYRDNWGAWEQIDEEIERVKKGISRVRSGRDFIEIPWDLKGRYLKDLATNYMAKTTRGKKLLAVQQRRPYYYEKGVDVSMTIHLCDIAADPRNDWVCLVTNDSDYVPVIERLQQKIGTVCWLSLDEQRRSRDLIASVGKRNSVRLDELFYRDIPEKLRRGLSPIQYELFLLARWLNDPGGTALPGVPWTASFLEASSDESREYES